MICLLEQYNNLYACLHLNWWYSLSMTGSRGWQTKLNQTDTYTPFSNKMKLDFPILNLLHISSGLAVILFIYLFFYFCRDLVMFHAPVLHRKRKVQHCSFQQNSQSSLSVTYTFSLKRLVFYNTYKYPLYLWWPEPNARIGCLKLLFLLPL